MPEMILCPHCGTESVTEEYFGEYQTGCPHCGANAPCANSIEAAVSAWKDLPRMSTIIAWQLQAAGSALALQRLMDAAQTTREAQRAYEEYGSNEDSVTDAEAVFDGLLADMRKALEARNG